MTGLEGIEAKICKVCWMLGDWDTFGGDVGASTLTTGGERGIESEVVDRGRGRILELGRRGEGTGGPLVPFRWGSLTASTVDHGEDVLGMSSEFRVRV